MNQQTRDDQSRPYIIADFEPSEAGIVLSDFVVRNIGKTPAMDVQIRLTPPPARANETTNFPLSKDRLINGTLPMVAPIENYYFSSTLYPSVTLPSSP